MKGVKQGQVWRVGMPMGMCLLVSACAVGPNFQQPPAPATTRYTNLPLPSKTVSTPAVANAGKSQTFVNGADITGDWWQVFHSAQLNALIQQGLNNSPNLVAAKAALRVAKDTYAAQFGALMLPSVDLGATAERAQDNALSLGISGQSNLYDLYNTSIQSSYLLDIWGASRRQLESYAAQVDYERYELMGAYLTLTANIVTTSINIASFQAQIAATQQLINEEQKILLITQKQFQAGGASQENVLTQQTQLAETQATLPPLENSLSQDQHALAVLVGNVPSQQQPLTLNLNALTLPAQLPVSLPSALIEQRPDIQASSALLHQTSAQIGVATANLLPQITLTAGYGWLSESTHNLFNANSAIWSLAAGLAQPVFHGGALIMQRRAAIAAFDEAAAQYQQTVLQAFQNVADALRAIQIDAHEFQEQTAAERSALKTLQLTTQQYQVGGQNYLAVLNAQQQYQQTVIKKIKAQATRYSDTAALYQALGGGWWHNSISHYNPSYWTGV